MYIIWTLVLRTENRSKKVSATFYLTVLIFYFLFFLAINEEIMRKSGMQEKTEAQD